ncbi:MAG: TolC family protein [Acidobacteria bacterium]|nr:TolC family protein [Acidobacteriota bacterium]MBI3661625.1 TolC family protein [Acidobacteriota bacterium]
MNFSARLWILAALWGFWLSPPSPAQSPPQALTLEDCIRLAESAPSPVRLAKQQSEIANLGLKQTQAAFLPKAQFGSGFTYNSPLKGSSPTQSFVALNGVREYLFLLGTTQELDLSGRLRADKERARAEFDVAQAGETITKRDLKRSVTAAYYRLLLARHVARALRDSAAEAESFEKRTQLLLESGEASQADLAKASAAAAALRHALSEAELDARLANQELASFWTTAVNDPLCVADVFETAPGAGEAGATAGGARPFASRPEFGLLAARKRSFVAESRRIRAELLPQANVNFQYGLDSNFVRGRDHGYAVFVSLNVPVFDWFRTLNASREFRVRAEQTETQRAMAERAFSREYEAAQARVENALEQISRAARHVKLAEQDLHLSRIRFEGGEGPALDAVAAQNQLAQARVNYFTAIAGYWNARTDREVAAGR